MRDPNSRHAGRPGGNPPIYMLLGSVAEDDRDPLLCDGPSEVNNNRDGFIGVSHPRRGNDLDPKSLRPEFFWNAPRTEKNKKWLEQVSVKMGDQAAQKSGRPASLIPIALNDEQLDRPHPLEELHIPDPESRLKPKR